MTRTKPSKTARKREQLALQALGERLIGLTADELAGLPIDGRLRDALRAASGMTARGALRRQKQLIGKLMREVDPAPIRQALDAHAAGEQALRRVFARAERWRARIVSDGRSAIAAFAEETGAAQDSLTEMLAELDASRSAQRARNVRRRMFRHVHAALLAQARNDRISR